MSSCVKLINSMDLSYHCGLGQNCLSVLVQQSCLQSRHMCLTVAVSCTRKLVYLLFGLCDLPFIAVGKRAVKSVCIFPE